MLVWGAYLNMQHINIIYCLYYLLKYAVEREPHGPIKNIASSYVYGKKKAKVRKKSLLISLT